MNDFTTRDGATLRYRDTGQGEQTLVMLTGWSQTQAMYDRLVAEIGDQYRVVTYDHRNHGESGRSDNGARIASLSTDLDELLDHLDITKAHMLGHSMGVSVLLSYIDLHGTSRISSLVLIDQPSVCALVPWLTADDAAEVGAILDFQGGADFSQAIVGDDAAAARRAFLVGMLTPDIPSDDLEWMYAENLKLEMPFGTRLLVDHLFQDWRDVLPRIDVPTLVTGGEVSHVVPSSQEWSASQIPGADLHVFSREDGGGHFPFFEAPKAFAKVLTDFLDTASRVEN
ncbi:MAG: hypothetical protein JWO46_957 [Nocardioidaceae bacterium]|nr:hypothetical protein [Nocardioidaceae bacterium]